jgi:predicted nucleic-acid-binding protein
VINVDTSVLIRYFVQDDPVQAPLASRFLEEQLTPQEPGLVTAVTLCEMVWVLRRIYGLGMAAIHPIIAGMIAAPNLVVEHETAAALAMETKAGFADALLHFIGRDIGAGKTVTFDRAFARLAGVELLGS